MGVDEENFLNNQEILQLVIISFILVTSMFVLGVILMRENRYLSLLRAKGFTKSYPQGDRIRGVKSRGKFKRSTNFTEFVSTPESDYKQFLGVSVCSVLQVDEKKIISVQMLSHARKWMFS